MLSAVIFSACNWGTPKLASLEGVSQRRKSSPVTSHLILMVRPCWAVLLWNGIFTSAPVRQNTAIEHKIPWNWHEIFVVIRNFRTPSWTNAVIYRRLAVSPSPTYTIIMNVDTRVKCRKRGLLDIYWVLKGHLECFFFLNSQVQTSAL